MSSERNSRVIRQCDRKDFATQLAIQRNGTIPVSLTEPPLWIPNTDNKPVTAMPFCFQQDVKCLQPRLTVKGKACRRQNPMNHWVRETSNEAPWNAIGYVEVCQPRHLLASEPSQFESISMKSMKGVNRRSKTMIKDKSQGETLYPNEIKRLSCLRTPRLQSLDGMPDFTIHNNTTTCLPIDPTLPATSTHSSSYMEHTYENTTTLPTDLHTDEDLNEEFGSIHNFQGERSLRLSHPLTASSTRLTSDQELLHIGAQFGTYGGDREDLCLTSLNRSAVKTNKGYISEF